MLPFLLPLKIFKLGWCSTYRILSNGILDQIAPQTIVAELEHRARYIRSKTYLHHKTK
jgi:hypothetical protein